jgi:hypothetical protein
MSDNVPITAGTGTNIATDDIGGVHYQKVRLDMGDDTSAFHVSGFVPVRVTAVASGFVTNGVSAFISNSVGLSALVTNGVSAFISNSVGLSAIVTNSVGLSAFISNSVGLSAVVTNSVMLSAQVFTTPNSTVRATPTLEANLPAIGTGPGYSRIVSGSLTAASSLIFDTKGCDQIGVVLAGTWNGSAFLEYTTDGQNWLQETEGIDGTTLLRTTGFFAGTGSNTSVYSDSSATQNYRVRTSVLSTGTLNVTFVGSYGMAVSYGSIVAPRPDRIGITLINKYYDAVTTQTGSAMWIPATDKKIVITGWNLSIGGTTGGVVTLFMASSADTTWTSGTDPVLFRGAFAPTANSKPGIAIGTMSPPFVSPTGGHYLRITTDAAITLYAQFFGYEI